MKVPKVAQLLEKTAQLTELFENLIRKLQAYSSYDILTHHISIKSYVF